MACEVATSGKRVNDILSFLTEDEMQLVSRTIVDKLNKEWNSNLEIIEKLEIQIEKVATDSDQQKFLLEKQVIATQEKLEEEGRLRSESSKQIETLEEKIASNSEELQKANDQISSLIRQLEQCRSELSSATEQSTAMSGRLETKSQILSELNEQMRCLEEQLSSTRQSKCDAMIQAEEANALQIQLQFKERRFEQEKSLLANQVDLLQQQLEERTKELLTLRKEHSTTILSLQSDLAHALEELKLLRGEKESFQNILDEKSKKINELLSTVNEMRLSETRLEESFQQELTAQKKVASIYKASNEDKSKRCEELEKAIEGLRQLLREASEEYGALEKSKALSEEEARKSIDQSNTIIKDLHDELDKANELMQNTMRKDDALAEMSPAAAAASHLMSKGMTLTQLYAEYITTSENLFHSKEENKRLSRYIEQILEELQDKAPLMRQQKEDYQRALETINVLNTQIVNAIDDLEKQKVDAEEALRRANFLGRENDKLNQQVKDLGKQVTILLTQVEAARVGLPPPPVSVLDNMSISGGTSSEVIDQHLTTFRDVSELQAQNQKLLASLRDVTDKLESTENDAINAKTKALQVELEEARKQLEDLRNSREKMQTILEDVISQRDTYRTIVSQQSAMTNGTSRSISSPSASGASLKSLEKLKGELDCAQKELLKVKKDHEEYRLERNKNDQLEKNEFERIKSLFEKTRSENIRLLSHAEYNDERLKTLQSSCEAYLRQVNAHIEKSNTQQGLIGKHEATIQCLRDNMLDLTKKLSHAEVMMSNIKKERDILKECESHLTAERDSLHRSQYSQSLVLSNLEAIKNNLERSDSGAKIRYENQIADLTEQCFRLKTKIEANSDFKEATLRIKTMEDQLKISSDEARTLKNTLSETEQQLLLTKSQLCELQEKCRINQSQLSTPILSRQRNVGSPSPGSLGGTPSRVSPALSQTVRELQVQLTEERAKSTLLKANADENLKSVDHLKKLVDELESQLKNSTEAKNAAQEEINVLRKNLDDAEKLVKDFKEELEARKESEKALKDSMDHRLMKMTEDLEERENELEEVQKRYEDAKKSEEICRIQMNEQTKMAQDMQDKYEREVMLHGSDLTALVALKEKLADYNTKLEVLTVDKLKAEEHLKDSLTNFEKHENEMKNMIDSLKTREQELDDQNRSLLDQFTCLSDKMAVIHSKLSSSSVGDLANASFSEDEARSSEQLREIIKYLRRERELSTGKAEMAQAEAERLNAQKKTLENQLEFLNRQLTDERAKNTSSLETAGKYEEIMRKVDTMDALGDSNRLLREEKRSLEVSLHEYIAKSNSLKIQIEPLQEANKELQTKLDIYLAEKKSLENEKDLLKKRAQELVEKLNKSKPEDMIQLQQEIQTLQVALQGSDAEINRQKNMNVHYQKAHQAMTLNRNQVVQQLTNAKEENKKVIEENKKLSQEKIKLSQQGVINTERIQTLESSLESLQQQKNQLLQQIIELRQKEDLAKREIDTKETKIKELTNEVKDVNDKIVGIEKKNDQLRKIATKYKKKAEAMPDADSGNVAGEEDLNTGSDKIKELEEKNALLIKQLENSPKMEEVEKLKENIAKIELEFKKKEELYNIQREKNQLDSEAKRSSVDYKAVLSQLADLSKRLNESKSEKLSLENKITSLEREKEQYLQQIEGLNKKLQMQQKQLENLQKQAAGGSKGAASGISIEKPSSDPPPTANIKPMSAPSPAVSSPRSQVASQGGSSRSIPTASIRPMAPSSGQPSSVVIVQPMESHSSGDGAVSSTVTLPQATVTPTPVAPTSAPTQAFSSTLTATVSPTPMSACSVASTSPFTQPQTSSAHPGSVSMVTARQEDVGDVLQMPSGSADALISQAIAMVMPQIGDRLSAGSQKRKLDIPEDECDREEEISKRSRLVEDIRDRDQQIEDEEQEMETYEDAGEPSSSSSHPSAPRKIEENNEVLILSSDDEGEEPSSQTEGPPGRLEEQIPQDEDESQDGGREAEAGLTTETVSGGEGNIQSVQSSSSSLQPPPSRPAHEPPSSSRQSLAPFHQLPQYEEGADDRTVPSTPTLFVSRPCENAPGDGVSSPQVPSQGFEFVPGQRSSSSSSSEVATHSSEGLSQIAEGGAIDVTRMDLGQLDHEAGHRRSPAVEVCAEGNISSSGGEQESGDSRTCVSPSPLPGEASTNESEADSGIQGISRVSESNSQQDHEAVELNEDGDDRDNSDRGGEDVVSSQEPLLGEVDSPTEDEDDEPLQDEEDEEAHQMEEEDSEEHVPVSPPLIRATRSSAQAVPMQRRITPITWSQSPRPPRGPSRGGRGFHGGRGVQQFSSQVVQRFQGVPRGQLPISQRARRSRPGTSGSGSPN